MRQGVLFVILGAAIAGANVPASAQPAYDWSGFYVGGSLGVTESKSSADVRYNSSGSTNPVANWTDTNYFTGHIWRDVDGSWLELDHGAGSDRDSGALQLDGLRPWLTRTDLADLNFSGTAQVGGQWQVEQFVFGVEARGTFGKFGTSYSSQWDDDDADSDSSAWCNNAGCQALIRYADYPNRVGYDNSTDTPFHQGWHGATGWGPAGFIPDGADIDFSGSVHQDNSLAFGTSYNSYFAPVARVGIAADRWMIFGMGGPAVADVTSWTTASVREIGQLSYEYGHNSGHDHQTQNAEHSYAWDGTNKKTLWGYTVGGGVEYALTDHAILRFEGSYTNLGSIGVTGVSQQTGATYEVTQNVSNWSVGAGLTFKFK